MKDLGRILAVLLVGLFAGVSAFGSQAIAGEFTIVDCSQVQGPSSEAVYVETPGSTGFNGIKGCPIVEDHITISGPTQPGQSASLRIEALQGTGFLATRFWHYHKDSNGVTARFYLNNAGGANTEQVTGLLPQGTLWAGVNWHNVSDGQPRSILRGTLSCDRPSTPCGTGAMLAMGKTELKIRDSMAPTVNFLGGTLFDPGIVTGTRTAFVGGIDNGSGVSWLTLNVNGVLTYAMASTCDRAGLRPCPRDPTTTFNVDSTGPNFQNGLNKITLCAQDYSTSGSPNAKCEDKWVYVVK